MVYMIVLVMKMRKIATNDDVFDLGKGKDIQTDESSSYIQGRKFRCNYSTVTIKFKALNIWKGSFIH